MPHATPAICYLKIQSINPMMLIAPTQNFGLNDWPCLAIRKQVVVHENPDFVLEYQTPFLKADIWKQATSLKQHTTETIKAT